MNSEHLDDNEALFLRSLDSEVGEAEGKKLAQQMEHDNKLQLESGKYIKIREMLQRNETDSFGPFFAERVIHQIKIMKQEIDYQIFFFFKKYQLVVAGVVVALLILNIFQSDQLTLKSILGFEDETVEDIITTDLYNYLTE